MKQLIGTVLKDRYHLEDELGQGGMGMVYRATDTLLERPVAVKVLSRAEPDSQGRSRLLAEARSAAKLNHPNIVAIYDAGKVDQVPFVVMELVQGVTLSELKLAQIDQALKLTADVCAALNHAHQAGIIHRDVKPENVILTDSNVVKLMDFGLAFDPARSRLTSEGALLGTMAYLAPELILGQPATPQSDLYALGVMLYEMAAGQPPFEGDNTAVLLTNHLHAPVVPPSAHNPAIPPMLDALVVDLLRKDPAQRPPSAEAVLGRLEEIRQPAPTEADIPLVSEVPTASLLDRIARGRLVSRTEQLAQATQLWLRTLTDQAGMLLISGEPGIGKTRLARAIIAQARIGGATILQGGCYEFEATTPYLPLAEALRDWVHQADDDTLVDTVGSKAAELARLAPEIESRLGTLPPSQDLGAEDQRLRLFDNVARFLDKLAGNKGLLLFVDDLHWADQGTLALLSYLMRRLSQSPILILAGYREVELDRHHPLAEALVQWNRQRQVERIQLTRFTIDETNKLIATLFGQERVSDEFASAIYRETEGNPFFIEEVMKALVDQGQIYWLDDHWERDELEILAIPQSIKEAIGRRLNRLSSLCIEILHTAAVIGKDFPYPLLAEIASQSEVEIFGGLEEAISAQLIEPVGSETFIFTHDKIREVLYNEILNIRRNRLHHQIAEAIETGRAGELAMQIEALAYHTIAAGVLDKGLAYARQAAEHASNKFAFQEALEYYRQANECAISLRDESAQATIYEAMGDIYATTGPMTTAIDYYQQAISMLDDAESRASIQVKAGGVYSVINDEEGTAVLETALRELDRDKQPLLVAKAWAHLGRFYHYRCQYLLAIDYFDKARKLAEPLEDPQSLYVIYSNLAGAYQHLARMDESMAWARAEIALGERMDHQPSIAVGHEFIAENYLLMGYWNKSLEAARVDSQVAEKIGSANRQAWGIWSASLALRGMGELIQALEEATEALEMAETIGEKRLEMLAHTGLSLIYCDLGEHALALDHSVASVDKSQEMVELFGQSYTLQSNGYIHLQNGNVELAYDSYHRALTLVEGTDNEDTKLHSLAHYAEVLLHLGEHDKAAANLESSLTLSRKAPSPYMEGVAQRVLGQLLLAKGDFVGSATAFERAISLLTETNSKVPLGRAYYHRALMREREGLVDQAISDASQSQVIFDECDAMRDNQRAVTLITHLNK